MIADMPTETAVMVLREIRSIRHRKPDERGGIVTSALALEGRHPERERVNHECYQQREQPVGTLPRGVELGLSPALVRALAHHLRLTQTSGAVTEISRGERENVFLLGAEVGDHHAEPMSKARRAQPSTGLYSASSQPRPISRSGGAIAGHIVGVLST
eukprot:scaffold35157_cov61-Phaeocystis_antarctica.AAC.2